MYRAPVRPPRSPGALRPAGRFSSPASSWRDPGAPVCSPYGGSPRGYHGYTYSPGSHRGYRDGSPARFGSGSRGGFQRSGSDHHMQGGSSDSSVEKYFSPSMLQDPWAALLVTDAPEDRRTS
ncbi:M-phase-specific PLK1-interacting protein [Sebastes umbrosus]|uniref:M-phase-specific PLK1-interacting protein n=1 Tax=Sebastes umbrosus TaxID=72105 RepID=UPI00189F99A9|nr:M-phase-specific PLK1-interacting protein [Sebastes umbrosus]